MEDTDTARGTIVHLHSSSPRDVHDSKDVYEISSSSHENVIPSEKSRRTAGETTPQLKEDDLDTTASSDSDDSVSIDQSTGQFEMHRHLGFVSSVSMCVGTIVGKSAVVGKLTIVGK